MPPRLRQSHGPAAAFLGVSLGLSLTSAPLAQPAKTSPAPQPGMAKEHGLVFEEKTELLGPIRIVACKSAVKLQLLDKQVTLVLRAPKWQLTMYNQRAKKYIEVDPSHWRAPSSLTVSLYRTSDSRTMTEGASKIEDLMGVKARVTRLVGPVEPPDPRAKHHWQELNLRDGTYWSLAETIVPPAAAQCVQKMLALPKAQGLPLQLTTHNQRGSTKDEIVLKKVQSVTVSPQDFAIPAAYTRAQKEGELWLDDRTEDVQDLIDMGK